jgi:hypothetical protein
MLYFPGNGRETSEAGLPWCRRETYVDTKYTADVIDVLLHGVLDGRLAQGVVGYLVRLALPLIKPEIIVESINVHILVRRGRPYNY